MGRLPPHVTDLYAVRLGHQRAAVCKRVEEKKRMAVCVAKVITCICTTKILLVKRAEKIHFSGLKPVLDFYCITNKKKT